MQKLDVAPEAAPTGAELGTSYMTTPMGEPSTWPKSDGDQLQCAVDIAFDVMQVDEEKVLEAVPEETSADLYQQQLEEQRKTIADLTQQNADKDALITETRGELQQ